MRYVVPSSGRPHRQLVLSLSTWWGGRVNVTCWHGEACRPCLPMAGLDRFSALVETETGLSALVEMETCFCFLVDAEICFSVHLLLHCLFLEVRLTFTSADGARGGSGGVASCGGCDDVSTATCAASAVDWMCGCGEALAKAVWAASAVSGKCQRRGPVSSRQPERRGWPSG